MIETRLMAPGQFTIKLLPADEVSELTKRLSARFHSLVLVIPGKVSNPRKTGITGLKAQAEYIGVLTGRQANRCELSGYGTAYFLKLAKQPVDANISKRPLYNNASNSWVRRLLRIAEGETNGITVGPITIAAAAASPTKGGKIPGGQEPLETLGDVKRRFGVEWTCDKGVLEVAPRSSLFRVTPNVMAATKRPGAGVNTKGLALTDADERDDVDEFATTVAVPFDADDWDFNVAYAVGDTVQDSDGVYYECTSAHTSTGQTLPGGTGTWATKWDVVNPYGEATTGSPPYKSPLDGNALVSRRVVRARNASTLTDADVVAAAQLDRYDSPQRNVTLSTAEFYISGKVKAGDNIWAYDPDLSLVDDTASIPWQGGRLPAATVRVQAVKEATHSDKTVVVYSWDGAAFQIDDVSPWVAWERKGQVLELGEPKRRRPTTAVTV